MSLLKTIIGFSVAIAYATAIALILESDMAESERTRKTKETHRRRRADKSLKILLPPIGSIEMSALAEILISDIIPRNPDVKWENIKGLENAKCLLREAIVMPVDYPRYFTGYFSPWKGILLFGPPGTGKTMLAKAVATECKATFFNISASSIFSKWSGEAGKFVETLFKLARHNAPSIIFFNEIDAIISQRGELLSVDDESRRCVRAELLSQMDELRKTNELVFVLAATNLPWDVDTAMLLRFEKRILIPLPGPEARRAMFVEHLKSMVPAVRAEIPYDILVEKTKGYSGLNISTVCREAAMRSLRRSIAELKWKRELVPENELPERGPVMPEDIVGALEITKSSPTRFDAHRYEKFWHKYGC